MLALFLLLTILLCCKIQQDFYHTKTIFNSNSVDVITHSQASAIRIPYIDGGFFGFHKYGCHRDTIEKTIVI